jgi:predicted Zn-ribbon and HTH transcriptional regulator
MGLLQEIGLIPLLVQLALLAMLYMWSTAGHRRNPDRGVARRRSSSEQIATLGYLYGKTLTPQLAFNRIHAEVQRRLTDALRCTPDQIASRIARLPDSIRNLYSRMQSRLAMARPSGGVVCRVCGYSLFANEPGRCPECGTPIQYEQVRLMAEAAETGPPSGEKSAVNTDVVMADVLSASHQLAQEIKRERRAFR